MKKKNIMIVAPQSLPIPAVRGGGIETLITNLITENERFQKCRLIVISKYDDKAIACKFDNTTIYYFDDSCLVSGRIPFYKLKKQLLKCSVLAKRIFRKLGIVIHNWNDSIVSYLDDFHFSIYQIAKKEKIDILINECEWNAEQYRIFIGLVGKGNIFCHLHCATPEHLETRKIINNSICLSEYVKNTWVRDTSIVGKNYVLFNGIDIDRFNKRISDPELDSLRNQLRLSDNDCVLLFCGRIIPEKGLDYLIDAVEQINSTHYKLLVIGSVDYENNSNTEYSTKVIKRMNDNNSIIYLGYIPNSNLPKYYQISDIMIVPSVCQEGAGLVAIEGMASGLPLIVTKSGGMVEYVDNETAIEVPIDRRLSSNLKDEIIKLSKNKEKMKQMGEKGRIRSLLFSKGNYYKNFIGLFED